MHLNWKYLNSILFILLFSGTIFSSIISQKPFVEAQTGVLTDSTFDASSSSSILIQNGVGQNWYESRNDVPSLLYLDTSNLGGNTGKKAGFTASSTGNAYLTQEFSSPQTGVFSAQWDIYVDSILSTSSRAGLMMIGYDGGSSPNRSSDVRLVYMDFYKSGGGTSGTMDLRALTSSGAATTIASGLNLKQWYTVKVVVDVAAKSYDIYVNGVLRGSFTNTGYGGASATHISFAQWNDGAGAFYVDNVYAPAQVEDLYTLTVTTSGQGSVSKSPSQSSYASGSTVQLTATPASGYVFSGWSGGLTGSANPASVTVNGNKAITATFTQITNLSEVLNGFSGTPTSTQGVDKIIAAMNKYGMNCFRASFNPPWVQGTRKWNPSLIDYYLTNCNYYIIIDRVHLYPPSSTLDWKACETAIFNDVLSKWGNNPRVIIEIVSEYNGSDQFTRTQSVINDIRAAGYTNMILVNKQPSSNTWVKLTDPLVKVFQGGHYYFADGQNNLSTTETRTQMALSKGISVVNTEVGASWNETPDYTTTNVNRLSQWLAWSKSNNVGNMIWLNHNVDNLATYVSLGLVIPSH